MFQTIKLIQPDVVMVELCPQRVNMLMMDEATILKEASEMSLAKAQTTIKKVTLIYCLSGLLLKYCVWDG